MKVGALRARERQIMYKDVKYREIPYNYTSFSDREIILKYFDDETWEILTNLRTHRVTGRSARLFYEVIGDLFIIDRNPYIFNDFLENRRKQTKLKKLHRARLDTIRQGTDNEMVLKLVDKVQTAHEDFFARLAGEHHKRNRILNSFRGVTSASNISFSAFHKVLHVTDATDWRVEYPDAVVYPDTIEQTARTVRRAVALGMKIIPRGGGTGLTGGAIPVTKNTLVINTEKLNRIKGMETVTENGRTIPLVTVEAGVVTDHAMEYCLERGYIFATDPTSAWASTIGGNIAENAGGKKAVMWGTTIDNIYSYQIINARGHVLEVKRRDHPHRKILPDDEIVFDVCRVHRNGSRDPIKSITLTGNDIRKKGVGKDITNKALCGLPGIQKEGGDGIIVSAKFVLYTPFTFVRTLCLEFFGKNMINASKAIVDITEAFYKDQDVYLTALEHFDEKYVSAIDYRNKSNRSELPKAVLLIDIECNEEDKLEKGVRFILDLVKNYNTEGFVAKSPEEREKFWKDRKNLGAIAKHTNAFKLNEDVVIPLEALPRFSDYIEMLNEKKELENRALIAREIIEHLSSLSDDEDEFLASKISHLLEKMRSMAERFEYYSCNLGSVSLDLNLAPATETEGRPLFALIRDGLITVDTVDEIVAGIGQTFHGYSEIIEACGAIIEECKKKQIIIATHMHAGDGNIHVNIPVNSNDYPMLREADDTAGQIMEEVKTMGGVISGEHGIGLTKLKYIDQHVLDEFAAYKKENDPHDVFNPGKLRSDFPQSTIYTPSLNLLEREAFILEATDLEKLTTSISACVRCGKCKDTCNTHFPGGTMFYNPRNKILGVSLIVEAVLYEAQTNNTLGLRNFTMLRDISNHCTMCHNCLAPCPVKIDFGQVTLSIKRLLVERKPANTSSSPG
jgi:FAD/FMN-containing dehydrogenase